MDNNIDICTITETWLKEKDDVTRAELNIDGYIFKDVTRENRQGGGIGILHRSSITSTLVNYGETSSFEYATWKLLLPKFAWMFHVIYRPPYSEAHPVSSNVFFKEFSDYLESACSDSSNFVITGDFNLHVNDKKDPDTGKLSQILDSYSLSQLIQMPTHLSGNTLDLLITSVSNKELFSNFQSCFYISDHSFVSCHIGEEKPGLEKREIRYRKIKSIDHNAMKNDLQELANSYSKEDDLDTLVVTYESGLKCIMDKHAPVQTKMVTVRPLLSWYDPSLKVLKRSLRKAEQKWHKQQSQESLRSFKTLRSSYNNKLRELKSSFIKSKIEECAHDSKQFFKVVNQITNNSKMNPLPTGNRTELAENFSNFFGTKIEKIRSQLDKFEQYEPIMVSVDKFEKFPEIDADQIRKLIVDSKTTDCHLDPFPTRLVKEYIDVLLPLITKMVNLSLANGSFPRNWKEAILIPLLKNLSLELVNKNYRPVSNLQFISKVAEKAALSSFIPHLKEHNLLPSYQSAYRKHYSTETALVKVQNDLLIAAANHKV